VIGLANQGKENEMKATHQSNCMEWGRALMILVIVALACALAAPYTPISVAQDATPPRPEPGPTRPGPGPGRDTPAPPTPPPEPTTPPEPTATPGPTSQPQPTSQPGAPAATPTPVLAIMPATGGSAASGFALLLVGLVIAVVGFSASAAHHPRQDDECQTANDR
jgi:hypothetical protein